MNELPLQIKRDYSAVAFSLLSAVVGVILMRIVVYYVPIDSDTYGGSLAVDALFSLTVQLVFFLTVPFLIFKFYGKRTVKQTLEFSSVGAFKPYYLFALPLGVCVFIATLGISSVWSAILSALGYTFSSQTPMPETFNGGFFVAEILMTAALPAVCEEFVMRGGLLTTAKTRYGTIGCVVLCGVAFGLFHQNVRQLLYPMFFGALAAFLTLKLKSIYPAVLLHFTNNLCNVYFSYADEYRFIVGGGFYDTINFLAENYFWGIAVSYVAVLCIGAGLVYLMLYFKDKRVMEKKMEVLKDSAFDATKKRVVLMGEFDPERVKELEMEKEVYGGDYKEQKYKPSLRDIALGIALIVVTSLTTVFTFVWGFFR